eukprot:CAMPEP_0113472010 /NCGR_PEP_ID=MMETSP0014_2-20120614/17286_1 /TAXON_ID=2857 /ORGANISM="Nitzschia sp." /LENGTH=176 /DNA_ID=CAMNT_0000364689 /DNA_START=637 /DNA_END=1167 /DNA_ORIENTATION=+ /assembly_acc=CAM_ASM_000159
MTVALAVQGCSLVSLHAAFDSHSPIHHHSSTSEQSRQELRHHAQIHDVFYVVDRTTGRPFQDEELYDLASSLLESLKSPMMSIKPLGSKKPQPHAAVAASSKSESKSKSSPQEQSQQQSQSQQSQSQQQMQMQKDDDEDLSTTMTQPPPPPPSPPKFYKTIEEQTTVVPSTSTSSK